MVIVALTTVVIYAEQNLNKDILDLRINITIIMQDIENNCSKLLQKYPNLINLPDILPTCWRVHGFYRYGKLVVVLLIVHDCVSMYLVSGGPFSYFCMSMIIGILSILGVYMSQMGLILVIDFIYVILGIVIVTRLFNKCFTPLPAEQLRTL